MRLRTVFVLLIAGLGSFVYLPWGALAQKPFREYRAIEYEDFPLPADYQEKTEWTRARLKYPAIWNLHGSYEGGPPGPGGPGGAGGVLLQAASSNTTPTKPIALTRIS